MRSTYPAKLRLKKNINWRLSVEYQSWELCIYTVKKAERDAGPKHEGDGKFHHPRRTIGKIRQHQKLGLSTEYG
jgi:hypothetical protein